MIINTNTREPMRTSNLSFTSLLFESFFGNKDNIPMVNIIPAMILIQVPLLPFNIIPVMTKGRAKTDISFQRKVLALEILINKSGTRGSVQAP